MSDFKKDSTTSFISHLVELRSRLIKSFVFINIICNLVLFSEEIYRF